MYATRLSNGNRFNKILGSRCKKIHINKSNKEYYKILYPTILCNRNSQINIYIDQNQLYHLAIYYSNRSLEILLHPLAQFQYTTLSILLHHFVVVPINCVRCWINGLWMIMNDMMQSILFLIPYFCLIFLISYVSDENIYNYNQILNISYLNLFSENDQY